MNRRTKLHARGAAILAMAAASSLAAGPQARRAPASAALSSDLHVLIHDAGTLHLSVSNAGMIGSLPGQSLPFSSQPSAEWPAGSRVEYLYAGGLWVGAIVDTLPYPAVSTAEPELEFRAPPDPVDIIYSGYAGMPHGERYPGLDADDDMDGRVDEEWHDGRDNDGDGAIDEDLEGVSELMMSRWYTDDNPAAIMVNPNHNALHISVRERTLQWTEDDYDDFVGFEYEIRNAGADTLEDVHVGFKFDFDAGPRDSSRYYQDDQVAMVTIPVDHGAHGGVRLYDFAYVTDDDGDGGQTSAAFGILLLDHTTDATGATAPPDVRFHSFAALAGWWGTLDGDAARYEVMSSGTVDPPTVVPRDYRVVVSTGPFPRLAPGESVTLTMAMVATPNDGSFANAENAARLYQGEWFDLDLDPSTGVDGKEQQVHWYIPGDIPMQFRRLDAAVAGGSVELSWDVSEGATPIAGFRVQRRHGSGPWEDVVDGYLPPDSRSYTDTRAERGRDYTWVVRGTDTRGRETRSPYAAATIPVTATELRQNHPNPFNPSTVIPFTLAQSQAVTLAVYDARGRRVATLVDGPVEAGLTEIIWDGVNDAGGAVASGVYFCRLSAGGAEFTKKMMLLK